MKDEKCDEISLITFFFFLLVDAWKWMRRRIGMTLLILTVVITIMGICIPIMHETWWLSIPILVVSGICLSCAFLCYTKRMVTQKITKKMIDACIKHMELFFNVVLIGMGFVAIKQYEIAANWGVVLYVAGLYTTAMGILFTIVHFLSLNKKLEDRINEMVPNWVYFLSTCMFTIAIFAAAIVLISFPFWEESWLLRIEILPSFLIYVTSFAVGGIILIAGTINFISSLLPAE